MPVIQRVALLAILVAVPAVAADCITEAVTAINVPRLRSTERIGALQSGAAPFEEWQIHLL